MGQKKSRRPRWPGQERAGRGTREKVGEDVGLDRSWGSSGPEGYWDLLS